MVALVDCHSECRSFVWCLVSVVLVWVGVPPVPPPPPPSSLMLLLLLVIRKREDLLQVPILTTGFVGADNGEFLILTKRLVVSPPPPLRLFVVVVFASPNLARQWLFRAILDSRNKS